MSELTDRLQELGSSCERLNFAEPFDLYEAADRIEALEAEVDRYHVVCLEVMAERDRWEAIADQLADTLDDIYKKSTSGAGAARVYRAIDQSVAAMAACNAAKGQP